jgi:capsular polysaccharide biosynthesis protein
VGVVGGYLYQHSKPKKYDATAELLFGANSTVNQLLGVASQASSSTSSNESATNVALASLSVLSARTAHRLGSSVGPISVSVSEAGSSDLVDVTATSERPAHAARIANAYANEFVSYTTAQQDATVTKGISALKREILAATAANGSAELATLQNNLSGLEAIAAVKPVDVVVAQKAPLPSTPSAPHPERGAILGLLIGVVIGTLAAAAAAVADPRLRRLAGVAEDERLIAAKWDQPVITLARRTVSGRSSGPPLRWCKRLLASGKRNAREQGRIVLLTQEAGAPDPGLGEAVAWDLSCAFAAIGPRSSCAFVQMDDRSRVFQASPGHGWADVLEGRAGVNDVVRTIPVGDPAQVQRRVDVLVPRAGHDPWVEDNARFRAFLGDLTSGYQYVVFFAPSPTESGAAAALRPHADVVAVVAQLRVSRRAAVRELLDRLAQMDIDNKFLIGVKSARGNKRRSGRTTANPFVGFTDAESAATHTVALQSMPNRLV